MSETRDRDRPGRWRGLLWVLLSAAVLVGVLVLLWGIDDTADVTLRETEPPAPLVSLVEVAASEARAEVSVFGELRPRWNAEIRAAVSGRIIEVHDAALAGTRVEGGTPLFSIEPTPYETAVAEAEMHLEDAHLSYLQAQNQVTVARRQFARDGIDPPNDLALYLPQQRIAERSVTSAEAQLSAARRQLADTEVTAPFSGFVTERMASLGQTVSVGEALMHLADDRRFEMVVELSQADWSLLDHPIAGGTAALFHRDGRRLGEARIRQGGGFLDPATRQVRIFLDVPEPGDGILSGDFLRVAFTGRLMEGTLTLPETALTRAGHVWFVDDDNLLQRTEPEILFRSGNTITIAAPADIGNWRVASAPLASFLPGLLVTPQVAER
ncbi:MAG: efflux RND transporter periplasmic adaptor subunit [Pseudomonadota bacterium]